MVAFEVSDVVMSCSPNRLYAWCTDETLLAIEHGDVAVVCAVDTFCFSLCHTNGQISREWRHSSKQWKRVARTIETRVTQLKNEIDPGAAMVTCLEHCTPARPCMIKILDGDGSALFACPGHREAVMFNGKPWPSTVAAAQAKVVLRELEAENNRPVDSWLRQLQRPSESDPVISGRGGMIGIYRYDRVVVK